MISECIVAFNAQHPSLFQEEEAKTEVQLHASNLLKIGQQKQNGLQQLICPMLRSINLH